MAAKKIMTLKAQDIVVLDRPMAATGLATLSAGHLLLVPGLLCQTVRAIKVIAT
jgi:uracil phosphoribosyltransferase